MKNSVNNKDQEEKMMKHAVMTALYLILALFLAVSQGDSGPCQSPIQHGVYADGSDEKGTPALMPGASSSKPVKDVPLLLKVGAAVNGTNVSGETTLFNLSRAGADSRHVRILWARLGPEDEPGARGRKRVTALTKAGECGNPARVQALVASGTDVSACDRNAETALGIDAATGYQEAVSALPVTGAENSVPTPYG